MTGTDVVRHQAMRDLVEIGKESLRWIYWFPWRRVVQSMPHWMRLATAGFVGNLFYHLSSAWRHITFLELKAIFGESQSAHWLDRVSRLGAQQYFKAQFELFAYPRLGASDACKLFQIEGQEYLDQVLRKGQGAVMLLSHLGANQMIMPALGFRGYHIYQLSRPARPENDEYAGRRLNRLFIDIIRLQRTYEESLPATHIDATRGLLRVFRCLKANQIVAIAGDGRYGTGWITAPFLQRLATFSQVPWLVAHRTGTPILPVFVIRADYGYKYKVIIDPPDAVEGQSPGEFIATGLSSYIQRTEDYFYKYPCQYVPYLYLARLYTEGRKNQFFLDYSNLHRVGCRQSATAS
ncbi:MAG: lysophospholipid acyltransferase family protein [Desulforhabdus sp.]|nr:lysophospholipid acyltransferase family protein [Desulforhabdus sp.]